jgi:hypothetical protein
MGRKKVSDEAKILAYKKIGKLIDINARQGVIGCGAEDRDLLVDILEVMREAGHHDWKVYL